MQVFSKIAVLLKLIHFQNLIDTSKKHEYSDQLFRVMQSEKQSNMQLCPYAAPDFKY